MCPGDVDDYDAVPLEYAGFCPVALVSGQGFVLPGNRRIGYLRYEGKFYSPSTVDRAEQVLMIKLYNFLLNSESSWKICIFFLFFK